MEEQGRKLWSWEGVGHKAMSGVGVGMGVLNIDVKEKRVESTRPATGHRHSPS